MTRTEFFNALWEMVKDSDVDFWEMVDDDGEGGVFVRFTNIQAEKDAT